MRVAGIDPGLAATGYGIIERTGNRITPLKWGVIRSGTGSLPDRLRFIHSKLAEILSEFKPARVGVEDIFTGRNPRSALLMGHARGVILLAAGDDSRIVEQFAPRTIKQAVVGQGNASKEQVRFMVYSILGISGEKIPIDASDALAVAVCCLLRDSSPLNVLRKRIIHGR